jgi:Fe-S-cluster-containing hydrogenase component 2
MSGLSPAAATPHRRLRPDARLGVREAACLVLHSRHASCGRCAEGCPVAVLRLIDGTLQLAEGCLGCGRCAAVCPTGALAAAGFSPPPPPAQGHTELTVDCWKVPALEGAPDAVRVPCLGGLSPGQVIGLVAAAGARPLRVLDRGWCENCSAGGGERHPAEPAITVAAGLLEACGMPSEQLPHLTRRELAPRLQPDAIPEPATQQRMSRRAFFGGLAARVTACVDDISPLFSDDIGGEADGQQGRGQVLPSLERHRLIEGLRTVARHWGGSLPCNLFPAFEVGSHCCDHHVCASLCPTGALRAYDDGASSGLLLDAQACIACGTCEDACPEGALHLHPQGDGSVPNGPRALTRHRLRECYDCGRAYPANEDTGDGATFHQDVCPACRKSRDFARAGFAALFGGPG